LADIVLLVVILIFGTKKLRNMQRPWGAVKNFKEGVRDDEPKQAQQDDRVIEAR